MSNINNEVPFSPTHISEGKNHEIKGTEGNSQSTSLIGAVTSVHNSNHEFYKGTLSDGFLARFNPVWQWLRTISYGEVSAENGSKEEGTELQAILTEGKNLHNHADLLRASETGETHPHVWNGSILQRCLVGAGLMSAAGYAVYRSFNARTSTGSQQSTQQPSNAPLDIVTISGNHGGNLSDSFGYHALHHDDTVDRTRHRRRHLPIESASIPLPTNSADDVRIEPVKKCYEYYGKGRLGGKKEVPCANEINNNIKVNNKKPGPPPYAYIYTTNQPQKCKTQKQEQKCQNTHKSFNKKNPYKKLNNLVLNIGKTRCFCPPPMGDNVHIINPKIHKKKAPPSTRKITARKSQLNKSASSTVSGTEKKAFTSLTENSASPHQQQLSIPRPKTRYFIAPRLNAKGSPVNTASSVAPQGGWEDVKIEKMFDFSCIHERNNMSWGDIVRQVGKTLRSPIQSLAAESRVVHHHNTLGEGCPSAHESQHLLEVTGKVDAVLSQVMGFLPGANPFIVLQQIVGPALDIYADYLDANPLDLRKIEEINQQVLFLSRQTIPTLTAKDMSMLYNKGHKTFDGGNITPQWKEFTLKDDGLYITLEGKEYKILNEKINNGIFFEKNKQIERAYFLKNENRWACFNPKEIVYLSHLDSIKYYGVEIDKSPWFENIEITLDKSNPDIMVVKRNGVLSKQIIMNGYVVPVEESNFDNELTVTTAVSNNVPNMRILIQSESGWQFERDSTSVDRYLELILISIKKKGVKLSTDNKFSFIKGDAFSYDKVGSRYIKYEEKYYEVNSVTSDVYALKDAPENYFITSGGELKLRHSTDILAFSDIVSAGVPHQYTKLYLEGVGYDDLIETGVQVTGTEPYLKVGAGVYLDKSHQFLFAVNDKFFILKSYTGNKIEFKSNRQRSNGLKLFRCGNTYLKIRDRKISPKKYKEILGCRNIRSPTNGAGCTPVWVEEELDAIFKQKITSRLYAKKDILMTDIVNSGIEGFPNLFHSVVSGKKYYLHDGHYFNAEIIPVGEALNLINKPVLRIFSSGNIFKKKRQIAIIMSEKKRGRIEIKTIGGFISEGANVSEAIADGYIKERGYRNLKNIKSIQGAIEQLSLSGKTIFPAIKSEFGPDIDDTTLGSIIRTKFYPPRVFTDNNYIINIIRPHEFESVEEFSLRAGAIKVRNHVLFIKNSMLPKVIKEIKKGNSNYNEYIGHVFNTDNVSFISGMLSEISNRITRLNENIVMDNIYLCSLYRKSVSGVDSQGRLRQIKIKENLLPEERQGTVAFALSDQSKRIYISLDKLYFVDPTSSDPGLRNDPVTDLTTTLLHEASHIGKMTTDYVYFPREGGNIEPVLDCVDSMVDKIKQGQLTMPRDYKEMSAKYINSVPLLRNAFSNTLEMSELAYLTTHDEGYLAHLFLNTADGVAILIRDLYKIADTKNLFEELQDPMV